MINPLNILRRRFILQRIKAYKNIEGWLTEYEAQSLYQMARRLRNVNSTIVEIGSWKGKSTYCLAKGLRSGTVYAIDPFDGSGEPGSFELYQQSKGTTPLLDQFTRSMTERGVIHKIRTLVGPSERFAGQITSIDLLFIDGDHSMEACSRDFENYAPSLASGGFLLFHDFDPQRPQLGPTWVIQNKVVPSSRYEFIGLFDSLWVCRKK